MLAWAVHSKADSACCDLDAVRCCIYAGAALPDTGGLKMFLAVRLGADGKDICAHVLAVRGYGQPGRVNLSTIGPTSAQRAAETACRRWRPVMCTKSFEHDVQSCDEFR